MEQLDYNLLFRWFAGLGVDDAVWDVTVFTKNRDRLLDGEIAAKFFAVVLDDARVKGLLSDEHLSVDGTLVQGEEPEEPPAEGRLGRAAGTGAQPRSRLPWRNALERDAPKHDQRRCHVLMENRNGLAVDAELTRAAGTAERKAAVRIGRRGVDRAVGMQHQPAHRPQLLDGTARLADVARVGALAHPAHRTGLRHQGLRLAIGCRSDRSARRSAASRR